MVKGKKSVEELYQKMTQYEHILQRPDSYIGDPSVTKENVYLLAENDDNHKIIISKEIELSSGFYKICDEIFVNARDQVVKDVGVTKIMVDVDKETGMISVYNDGEGIHTEMHKEHNIHVPEMIFSHLLTSTNYDNNEEKITGGKNGYGAKLTNIYSKYFKVETCHSENKEVYSQEFKNNMLEIGKPVIRKKLKKDVPFTRITFQPDMEKFGMSELTDDLVLLLEKRAYDLATCLGNVHVYFNGQKIKVNNMEKYAKLFFPNAEHKDLVYEVVNDRWEILVTVTPNDDSFQHVSFVNGIHTSKGGKHVDYVVNQITKRVAEFIKTKKKKTVKANYIKDNLYVFINSTIVNPNFDSQTKEYMTTKPEKFGSKCDISEKFIEKLCKTELIDRVLRLTDFKEEKDMKKTDGKKRSNISVPKLEDANFAGTNKGKECTLILTEGDSAKAFAISGLSVVGRDKYGVFPLRGKFLNVRDKSLANIQGNEEMKNLKKIMALQNGKVYNSLDELRYGKIMILTDADDDGRHIKGLLINFFETFWPSLLKFDNFLMSFSTPVVKVRKGNQIKQFYTMGEFQAWKDKNDTKGWKNKYYKGLGTSSPAEAKEYFQDMNKCLQDYYIDDPEECQKAIMLAFSKSDKKLEDGTKYSDKRKEWLGGYDKNVQIDNSMKKITYKDFINKDLIHFSNSDNIRSIPNIIDGFKPSHRKCQFGALKKNLVNEIKVAQLSGYIGEHSAYHHGEASLQGTIVGMAQDFVGSNNINLFDPIGQFGSRLEGGKDAASCRYIFTKMNKLCKHLFNSDDFPLLTYNYDDAQKIEPIYYVPIIPMILVNGTEGIGTGYSTNIPKYNPAEIIQNIKNMINGKPINKIKPWSRGFIGEIREIDDNHFISRGCYKFLDQNTMEISELPINTWTSSYKEIIEKEFMYDDKTNKNGFLSSYENHSSESKVRFILKFKLGELMKLRINIEKLERKLKLYSSISTTNMHLYDENEKIKKYNSIGEIFEAFFNVRLMFYNKRRNHLLKKLQRDLNIAEYKIKFIEGFIDGEIDIRRKEDDEVIEIFEKHGFPKFTSKKEKDDENNDDENNDDEKEKDDNEPNDGISDKNGDYRYLMDMKFRSLTAKKIKELQNEIDIRKAELEKIQNKDEKQLWLDDLNLLEEDYKISHQEYLKNMDATVTRKSSNLGKKKGGKKAKK